MSLLAYSLFAYVPICLLPPFTVRHFAIYLYFPFPLDVNRYLPSLPYRVLLLLLHRQNLKACLLKYTLYALDF